MLICVKSKQTEQARRRRDRFPLVRVRVCVREKEKGRENVRGERYEMRERNQIWLSESETWFNRNQNPRLGNSLKEKKTKNSYFCLLNNY